MTISEAILPTTLIRSGRLSAHLGVEVVLASETFQHTGSFKFRAAMNVALNVPQNLIVTASSGNFGAALAYACRLVGKRCIVVMPNTSSKTKVESVRGFGAEVDLIDVGTVTRAERLSQVVLANDDAYPASPFDDRLVIEGNATLARELADSGIGFDAVITPVGGGGLAAGLVTGFIQAGLNIPIYGAEPLLANDAARSFRAGALVSNEFEPQTLADGARTLSLGKLNWEILREGLAGIIEVGEDGIREAVGLLFRLANLKAEPTGALSTGALLTSDRFSGQTVCCIVSGGNVDPEIYRSLI